MAFEFELPPAPSKDVKAQFGEADLIRRSASTNPAARKTADGSRQADRRDEMHRLQGLSGGVSGMERPDGADRLQLRRLRQSGGSHGGIVSR